jgi:hypothetical protein
VANALRPWSSYSAHNFFVLSASQNLVSASASRLSKAPRGHLFHRPHLRSAQQAPADLGVRNPCDHAVASSPAEASHRLASFSFRLDGERRQWLAPGKRRAKSQAGAACPERTQPRAFCLFFSRSNASRAASARPLFWRSGECVAEDRNEN